MADLRADQVLMIGVVALGAYAVYRLTRASGSSAQTTEPIDAQGNGVATGQPFQQDIVHRNLALTKSPYAGRLDLAPARALTSPDGLDRRIGETSSAQEIRAALEALGFVNVQVFMNATEARNRILAPAIDNITPTSATRWFVGNWQGENARPKTLSRRFTFVYPTYGGATMSPEPPTFQPDAAIWRSGAQVIARAPQGTADLMALLDPRVVLTFQGGELVKRTGEVTPQGGWARVLFQTTDGRVLDGWVDPTVLISLAGGPTIAGYPLRSQAAVRSYVWGR